VFAVIAVNAPVRSGGSVYGQPSPSGVQLAFPGPVFHYHVPPELGERAVPGVLVEVPLGPRQAQGLIVALADAAPIHDTRPVTRVLLDEPVLTVSQIELGNWLSQYYCSPLIDCLRLMLPPGLLRRSRMVVRLHPEVPMPAGLSPAQQQVVDLVQRYGRLSASQIARRLGKGTTRQAVRTLIQRGILIRGEDLPAPRAQPKRVNFVRLSSSPPQVQAARPHLGHPSHKADVLQALLDRDDPLPSMEQILARTGASPSILAVLARKGWVEVEPERTLIVPLPAAEPGQVEHAPRQKAVLDYLRAQAAPVAEGIVREAAEASASVLQALREKGLIQALIQPSVVHLRLDEQEARRQVVSLRQASRQHAVLDYLLSRPAGEWVWVSWVYAETGCSLQDLRTLEGLGLLDLAEREVWRDSLAGPSATTSFVLEAAPRLTPDQERAWAMIQPYVVGATPPAPVLCPSRLCADKTDVLGQAPVFLLHGVTGSGKTEVYMRAVEATLQQGRQAIVLVPEISLTPQTVRRFAVRFRDGLAVLHSALSDGERYDTWRRIRAGQVRLVIGPRSALFSPLNNIGLIVLDEEHADAYKESERMPTYHARQVARHIAAAHKAVVILGSATPDVTSYYQARETPTVHLLELPQRILQHRRNLEAQQAVRDPSRVTYRPLAPGYEDVYAVDMPPVRIVDMRQELRSGNRSMFSRALQQEMQDALSSGEQVILFLNRRGASTFVLCRDCGTAISCPRCDIPLTFHLKGTRLTCHHCNFRQPVPQVCPSCHSQRIKYFGTGTQQVEEAVCRYMPAARVLRWDRDTTTEQGSHAALLDRFVQHQADVLVGTQMIAKGLDLPLVTVVGVISADTALRLPDFRAAERTFQLLAQVAGRAGRSARGGRVIVQTYAPEHYAIQSAARHDYAAFYAHERAFRQQMGYPPFSRLIRLVRSDTSPARCQQQAHELASTLHATIQQNHLDGCSIIGPAPCFLSRLRGRWRWQIIVRVPPSTETPDPLVSRLVRAPEWRVDIDPLDML